MSIGIEFLIITIIVSLFSNGGIYVFIYSLLSVIAAIVYYLFFIFAYKKLNEEDKNKYKNQINNSLILVSLMIITINLVYPLGMFNLIFGICVSLYFILLMVVRIIKKEILIKTKFINYNYMFDFYCIISLFGIFMEMINYGI